MFSSLRASPPAASPHAYRLRQWPGPLPPALYTANVLRALSVMSSRHVTREWLQRQSKLNEHALEQFLALLVARGELDVVDTSGFAPG